MEKLISCCGLDCAGCDARIATLADDNELRTQTAEKWKVQHGAECEIRKCVNSKGYETCANCEKLENCEITKSLHEFVPEALLNLKSLN